MLSIIRIFYYALNYSVQLARSHNHRAGQWELTSPSKLHTRARNSRSSLRENGAVDVISKY